MKERATGFATRKMASSAAAAAPAAAAAVAGGAGAGEGSAAPRRAEISLDILEVTRVSQTQHGMRSGDYLRYRQYCTRKIHRLRVGLKMQQGNRKEYRKRNHDVEKIAESKDPRYIEVALFQVERAWAYAMQLKGEVTEENPRPRFHLRQRLTAVSHPPAGPACRSGPFPFLCSSSPWT